MRRAGQIGMMVFGLSLALGSLCVATAASNEVIMLDMEIGTNRCRIGEAVPVTVTWRVRSSMGLFRAVDIRLPVMASDAFKTYETHKKQDQPDSKSRGIPLSGTRAIANISEGKDGNEVYTQLRIKKVIVPVAAGSHRLKPATVSCALRSAGKVSSAPKGGVKGAGSLYQYPLYFDNSFFDKDVDRRDKKLEASAESFALEVLPLPPNAPAEFSGLVGQYQFAVSLSTNVVRQGDPLVMSLSVSSAGYLAHVKLPPLDQRVDLTNSFRVASDRRLRSIDGDRIVFTQTIYPLKAGKQSLPSLPLCYFNPVSGQYETSRSAVLPVRVEKARVIDGSVLGIVREEPGDRPNALPWILILLALGILVVRLVIRSRRGDGSPEEEAVDLAAAHEQFLQTLALLKGSEFENARDQHDALNLALGNVLAAHLAGYRPGAITFSDLDGLLQERRVNAELRRRARRLFQEMNLCRFSPAAPTMDYAAALSEATELIDALR